MSIDLSESMIEATCLDYLKKNGFVKILSNENISKLNELAFVGLMREHAQQKKLQATSIEMDYTCFLPAKMILTLIEQYCHENFKDQTLKKDKMISYMKDFYVINQNEPNENFEQLFLSDTWEDPRLNTAKYQIGYLQMRKMESQFKTLIAKNKDIKFQLKTIKGKSNETISLFENKIQSVKKLCTATNKKTINEMDNVIEKKMKFIDSKVNQNMMLLDEVKRAVDWQESEFNDREDERTMIKRIERKVVKKLQKKYDKRIEAYERDIVRLKAEFEKQTHGMNLMNNKEEEEEEVEEEEEEEEESDIILNAPNSPDSYDSESREEPLIEKESIILGNDLENKKEEGNNGEAILENKISEERTEEKSANNLNEEILIDMNGDSESSETENGFKQMVKRGKMCMIF